MTENVETPRQCFCAHEANIGECPCARRTPENVEEWRRVMAKTTPIADRLRMACPMTWPAATSCSAWGAPMSHGCKRNPGHDGICKCACGRERPISEHSKRPATLILADAPNPQATTTQENVEEP